MNVLSSFVVIALCGVVAFFLYLFAAGKIPGGPRPVDPHPQPGGNGPTVIRPNLKIEQLDEDDRSVFETFRITVKEGQEYYISRPDGGGGGIGDIILKADPRKTRDEDCAFTVSNCHAVIARDAQGLFIQDHDSTLGMFLGDGKERQDELPIEEAMTIRLGFQYLRITPIDYFSKNEEATVIKKKNSAPSYIRRKRP